MTTSPAMDDALLTAQWEQRKAQAAMELAWETGDGIPEAQAARSAARDKMAGVLRAALDTGYTTAQLGRALAVSRQRVDALVKQSQ